jgi:pilus assembly protein CpaB
MKAARLVVLGIAIAAGGVAAMLAAGPEKKVEPPPAPVAQLETVDVLTAKSDIGLGQSVAAEQLQWQVWPAAAAGPAFIVKSHQPDAITQLSGSIARIPVAAGEPIRESKLIKANGSGFMAAILPSGMRAISTEISPETGAGGFILPNDHVDVILSTRDREAERLAGGVEVHVSLTILRNVRVLAIDQTIEEKEKGQKVVVGKTATLELTPPQAEILANARTLGTLSLALRSLVDSGSSIPDSPIEGLKTRTERGSSVNMVRFGITTTAHTR